MANLAISSDRGNGFVVFVFDCFDTWESSIVITDKYTVCCEMLSCPILIISK